MRQVSINGKSYQLAYNLRVLFVYEEIAGKPFTGVFAKESYVMLYAMLYANNRDFPLTLDELIDACDADMGIFEAFKEVMAEEQKRCEAFLASKKKAVTQ